MAPSSLFSEFQDNPLVVSPFGSGDVKYHKGYSTDRFVESGERVHLTLTSNPSHLEAVDPVVIGRAKAKQVRSGDTKGRTILPPGQKKTLGHWIVKTMLGYRPRPQVLVSRYLVMLVSCFITN